METRSTPGYVTTQSQCTRRRFLFHSLAAALPALLLRRYPRHSWAAAPATSDPFAEIERRARGRLGVAVLDTGSNRRLEYRADERFPMCSTFKLLLASSILARVDAGRESLARAVPYTEKDLLEYAPVTRAHVHERQMSVSALCAAAIQYSDNTAANLLLGIIRGPDALTKYVRTLGDDLTRLDRTEPTLNESIPGDPRDTTTPAAMLADMQRLLLGGAQSPASRAQLIDWLVGNTTGGARLRAGLPGTWRVGDKTGTGERGSTNDVAIVWPERRAPILIAAYLTECEAAGSERNAALADVARVAARLATP